MSRRRNPTTTGLKCKHFSRPPCRGCKTPCPVHGRQETNRLVCAPDQKNRLWFLPQLKNSEPVENRQAVAHGRSRPGTVVPGRGKVVEPMVHGSSNRVQPALKQRECKRGFNNVYLGPLLLTWINFNPAWISNHIQRKVWDEIYLSTLKLQHLPRSKISRVCLCSYKWRIMYLLEWRTVSALTRGLFWCLFPELRSNEGNKYQNNARVSTETVRHEST